MHLCKWNHNWRRRISHVLARRGLTMIIKYRSWKGPYLPCYQLHFFCFLWAIYFSSESVFIFLTRNTDWIVKLDHFHFLTAVENVLPLILQDNESLFMEKSFVGLLVKAKIFKAAFFFSLDCLYHGSVSLPTTGRIKGEIHVQHYSFSCSSKINFAFRVSLKCSAYGI